METWYVKVYEDIHNNRHIITAYLDDVRLPNTLFHLMLSVTTEASERDDAIAHVIVGDYEFNGVVD